MAASSFLTFLTLMIALCCGPCLAAFFYNQSASIIPTHDEGCVHLPIIHSTKLRPHEKRGVQLQLANKSDVAYYAQLSIGTPPQPVFVQLDTGSFELWVNPDCDTVSGSDAVFCDRIGFYDVNRSSTVTQMGTNKTLRYGIGSANITYVRDTITLAGSTTALEDVQFGVATSSEDAFSGILGIGYGNGIATRYPNFVDQLYDQNATRVKAYTLALGSKEAEEGVIVFGGVDTSKFAGPLTMLPIIPAEQSPDKVPRFWVNMTSITFGIDSGRQPYEGSNIPVFLDSGSTMTLLPPNLTADIARDFGSPVPDDNGFFRVDCAFTEMEGTVDFSFDGGLVVKVPYKEMIREVEGNSGNKACFLGITPSSSFTLLGDTFLRSAYTVFDLENDAIWMTQAANCGSTPAALRNVNDLETLRGACGLTNAGVVTDGSSTGAAGGSSSTGNAGSGAGVGSGAGTGSPFEQPSSATAGSGSGSSSPGSTGVSQTSGVLGGRSLQSSSSWSLTMGLSIFVGVII
ncbi:putative aspartic-type endopeptidase [Rhypophila decipiens]